MKAETRFIWQIQKMTSDRKFQKSMSEMLKKISRGQENLCFQTLSCTQSGIPEVRSNLRQTVFQNILQQMKSAGQLYAKPDKK